MIKGGTKGSNTITGKEFEERTDLLKVYSKNNLVYNDLNFEVRNKKSTLLGYHLRKENLYIFLKKEYEICDIKEFISKKILPDECFINEETKTVHIFEKKFQSSSGSVDEKLQCCDFKREEYEKIFNVLGYSVNYTFVLNDWFKKDEYSDVLDYIKRKNCNYIYNDIKLYHLGLNVKHLSK